MRGHALTAAAAALLALQAATFRYVLSIEQRLTRLETLAGLQVDARELERRPRAGAELFGAQSASSPLGERAPFQPQP